MKSGLICFFLCASIQNKYSLSQEIECPSDGISYIPLPDCTKYLICIRGQGVETECPQPLFYNPDVQNCDFPENVEECVGGTRPPIEGSSTTTTTTTSSPTESSTTNPTDEPTTPPPSNILTQCGQTLQADSGVIEYKLNETYDAGELCAFIIRLKKFHGVTFVLETHGISDADPNALAIFALRGREKLEGGYLGPPSNNGNRLVFDGASGFIIVFNTKTNSGSGFRLTFEGGGEEVTLGGGVSLVFNNETGSPLELPLYVGPVFSGQWDPIVLTSGAKLLGPDSSLRLRVWEDFPNPDCWDYFDVHSFDGESTTFLERLCGTENENTVFHTKGIFIILFQKRSSVFPPYQVIGSLTWAKVASREEESKSYAT